MNKKKVKKKMPKKSLRAADRQNVRILAEQLGKILPLSGFRSSFDLNKVAKTYRLNKYIPTKSVNKKEAFAEFIEKVLVNKPRMLKKMFRGILPKAIERRHANGDPILEIEASSIASQLYLLGVDMRKEIRELKLPKERPIIVPPPISIQKILDTYILHAVLLPDCKKMFIEGHINESVRKALERFEKKVQELSLINNKEGSDLMATAFNEAAPRIKLSELKTKSEVNEQIGFKFICMGIMLWWRNNLSHGDEPQIAHHEAISRLILVSSLFHRLDSRVI